MLQKSKFFSPGKLLLTSEYVVLDGALALAVPTKLGQELEVEETDDGKSTVYWNAFHKGHLWLKAEINYQKWEIIKTNLPENAAFILKVLQHTARLSETKFKNQSSYSIKTNLQFPSDFGLGSSSTLMNNLANWALTDAFELNECSLGGSGYDIAVAQKQAALLYQNTGEGRKVEKVDFNPPFLEDLILIHLNQKQNSREGIELYRSKPKSASFVNEFSEITRNILAAQNLSHFSELMTLHENRLSSFLGIDSVKNRLFSDCPTFVKSLGAWGGDFVLSTKFGDYKNYFSARNFTAIFSYKDLII